MEKEAFFLTIAYRAQPLPSVIKNGKEIFEYMPQIRRACLRKPERNAVEYEGFAFKRVNVDFDPSSKQLGYVVVIHAQKEDSRQIIREEFHFPGLTETPEEAQALKEKMEQGAYADYLVKNQKFYKATVEPVLISET